MQERALGGYPDPGGHMNSSVPAIVRRIIIKHHFPKLRQKNCDHTMDSASRSSLSTSPFSKLPPIVSNDGDRLFLSEINKYVEKEMTKLDDQVDEEQKYIIYKAVFNKVIEHVTAYKPILTSIKKEYETTIDAIINGQKEAVFLQGKLKAMASTPSTVRNYRKRADQLEERINYIKRNNQNLATELEELQRVRKERTKKDHEIKEIPKKQLKKDIRMLPGVSLEEQTDPRYLNKTLIKLDRQLRELNNSFKTRYLPKKNKDELKEYLDKKVSFRDHLLAQSRDYKTKSHRLKIALEASEAYNRAKPPHQTVGDAVILAFQHYLGKQATQTELSSEGDNSNSGETSTQFEEDDPNKEKEAEMMLEYIEKFNELFEDGKFEEAAIHAANSPKGILRTQATLAKFREVQLKYNGGRTPLLAFCDALMSSVKVCGNKPTVGLSVDCVKCALNENKLDLLSHWIAQDSLSLSRDIGVLLEDHCSCKIPCQCGCQALAQSIFTSLKEHHRVILCLLKQGRVLSGLQYAKSKDCLDTEFLVYMVKTCPSLQLLLTISKMENLGSPLLPVGVMLKTLIQAENIDLGVKFLQQLQLQKQTIENKVDENTLRQAIFSDDVTNDAEWNMIVKSLQEAGHKEFSLQMSAIILVIQTLKNSFDKLNYKLMEV